MTSEHTIAAISSAVGVCERIIVRMSGHDADTIAHRITTKLPEVTGGVTRTMLRCQKLEFPAWIYRFIGPRSATGENIIEFHIPGNPLLARMLLAELIERGARHAEPGEFTARAYFNRRVTLDQAEGVAATISAHNRSELDAARKLFSGELSRQVHPILESIADTLAWVEADIDFSDQPIEMIHPIELKVRIQKISMQLHDLLRDSARFERLNHEPEVVLCGRPNAGKSTLLNALSGEDRAIVSPVEGTTRDVISARVRLRRGYVRLTDIAGIDDKLADEIAVQMHERAIHAIATADLVVLVQDCTDARAPFHVVPPPALRVLTKSDLLPNRTFGELAISAQTGERLSALRELLDQACFGEQPSASTLALNMRHVTAIEFTIASLESAIHAAGNGAELVALGLREALNHLGEILGEIEPDDILGRVFSRFCIGK